MDLTNTHATGGSAIPTQSIVLPAFNEAGLIDKTLDAVLAYLAAQPYSAEVIVVNDGSSDDTLALSRVWESRHDIVQVVDIPHAGKAAAVRRGVERATGDLVAFADADLATPIDYLGPFREETAAGYDVVIGSREGTGATRIGEPAFRHVMGRVFNGLVRGLLLPGIQDTQCGFKMFTREAARELFTTSQLYANQAISANGARVTAFDVELLVVAKRRGYRVQSVPVTWTFGQDSKVSPVSDTINNLGDVLSVKLNDLRGRYD